MRASRALLTRLLAAAGVGGLLLLATTAARAEPPAAAQDLPAASTATRALTPGPPVETAPAPAVLPREGRVLLPFASYSSDNGIGLGAVGRFARYEAGWRPWRAATTVTLFATSRGLHRHRLEHDRQHLLGLPLRLRAAVGYFQSGLSEAYCGLGGTVRCDERLAEAAAGALGLRGEARDRFVRRYYALPFREPSLHLGLRFRVHDRPRIEYLAQWRARWHLPGSWTHPRPFDGSLYARDFPGGERGALSLVQTGVAIDTRDHEPAPTRGLYAEATLRVSSPYLGSAWQHVGANLTLRSFVPLDPDRRLVVANRLLLDALAGDVPTFELGNAGGSDGRVQLYGGPVGRGIRARRYRGPVRLVDQLELRWTVGGHRLGAGHLDWAVVGFLDLGAISEDLRLSAAETHLGQGLGVRAVWNRDFVVRFDAATSAAEGMEPRFYLDVGHVF